MSTPGAEAQFRRWLVQKLVLTRWPRVARATIEETAAQLWVHPDALRAAERVLAERVQGAGRRTVRPSGASAGHPRHRIDLTVPRAIYDAVHGYCRMRSTTPGVLLRSVIHQMLTERENPPHFSQWRLGKETYPVRLHEGKSGQRLVIKTDLTAGAYRALVSRAQEAGRTPSEMARALVMQVLHNQRLRCEMLTFASQMWDDETRYVLRTGS